MKRGKYYAHKYKDMYMGMAELCADQSKANKLKVGCVILLNDLSIFTGWNGMPSGASSESCEDVNGKTYPEVLHAEESALQRVTESMEVFYTEGSVAFITHSPCDKGCADKLIDFGVTRVYYRDPYKCSKGITKLIEAGIEVFKI